MFAAPMPATKYRAAITLPLQVLAGNASPAWQMPEKPVTLCG